MVATAEPLHYPDRMLWWGTAALAMPALSQIAAGEGHSCVARADGHLWCWGGMTPDELKAGTEPLVLVPEPATEPDRIVQVECGARTETCVVTNRGRVLCWTKDDEPRDLGLKGVRRVTVGNGHACALDQSSRVSCWGSNFRGQLGDGTFEDRAEPVRVPLSDVVQVDAGQFHTCALMGDATVACWGANSGGQLGLGNVSEAVERPTVVPGLELVIGVSAGNFHTCAVKLPGQVVCWGKNGVGQLGDGTAKHNPQPTRVLGLAGPLAVTAGLDHACALQMDGRVACWGGNLNGQLGVDDSADQLVARPVRGLPPVAALAAGDLHTCAITMPGDVYCWGQNFTGQLGDGTRETRRRPTLVSGPWAP